MKSRGRSVAPRPVAAVFSLILFSSCISPPGPVRHTPTAKLDGELAHNARRADVLGLTPTGSYSSGPVREGDIMRAFHRDPTLEAPDDVEDPSPDEAWLAAFIERGYHEDAIKAQWDESKDRGFYVDLVDDARVRFIAVDEHVKFYNEQGRDFEKGANFYLSNRASMRFFDRFLLTADPELSFVENDLPGEDSHSNLRFQELSLSARFGPAELTVGRQALWWGPGRHGTLLLTNNARPFDLVKLSTAGGILLPGFLSHLGIIRAEGFATRLESARAIDKPWFAGMRLSSRIFPWLELGGGRTMQFGGGDRSVTGQTVWEVITASTENDEDDPGNQIAALDARIIVPWDTQPIEIYGEYGGEDEAGGFFSRQAYLVGIYLPRILDSQRFEFTVEYADNKVPGHPRTWYTNRNYPDGYTFHERIIGHHMGTDAFDLFTELRMHPPFPFGKRLSVILSYDYEEHGRLDPVIERLHQIRAGVEFSPVDRVTVSAFFQHDIWENFQQNRGQGETGNALGVGARFSF